MKKFVEQSRKRAAGGPRGSGRAASCPPAAKGCPISHASRSRHRGPAGDPQNTGTPGPVVSQRQADPQSAFTPSAATVTRGLLPGFPTATSGGRGLLPGSACPLGLLICCGGTRSVSSRRTRLLNFKTSALVFLSLDPIFSRGGHPGARFPSGSCGAAQHLGCSSFDTRSLCLLSSGRPKARSCYVDCQVVCRGPSFFSFLL